MKNPASAEAQGNEAERIEALRNLGVLDTPAEERFDRITRVASRTFGVPIALISLVDVDRQWFKSCLGLHVRETSRAMSVCSHAIEQDEPLVIQDATLDPRFSSNPLVTGPPHIRFYAGRPLKHPAGYALGTLCVMDVQPKDLPPAELELLEDLGQWAETELNKAGLQQAVTAQREIEARLRAIVDSAGEGIITMDNAGTMMFVNPRAAELLSYSPEELLGRKMHSTVHHSREDGTPYPFEDCPVHRPLVHGESQHLVRDVYWRKDGQPLPVDLTTAPIIAEDGGPVSGVVVTFRDVSEREALERLKEQFVASVSHELRTPLTAIKGYLEALLDEELGPLDGEQRAYLEIVHRNANRLAALISDLLLLSKLEAGNLALRSEQVDIGTLLGELVEEFAPVGRAQGLTISTDIEPGVVISGDKARLRQALGNLMTNAIKFSSTGGTIGAVLRRTGAEGVIEIEDDGVGIPPEELPKLFNRFFRGSNAGVAEGTGLGLTITQEIVERHGGEIEVDSVQGQGSIFRILLQVADANRDGS